MAEKRDTPFWWPETPQTLIGVALVLAVIFLTFLLAFKAPDGDMFKMMVGGLMTVGFASIIGFYFGSSAGSKDKDAAMVKMAGATNGAPVITSWWSLLTEEEKAAITAVAPTDARVQAFVTTATLGHATADDLSYLVSKGLLTQGRATAIEAA